MKIAMTQVPQITVGNYGTRYAAWFEVRDQDNKLRGQVQVSQGGVEWKPSGARQGNWLSWDDFIQRMDQSP